MRQRMWCYNPNSESGKLLAEKLDVLRIKHEGSTFKGTFGDIVFNWGSSIKTFGVQGYGFNVINQPARVGLCSNKIAFFEAVKDKSVRIPDWTMSGITASKWLTSGGCVLARTKVEGKGGEGIVVMNEPVDLVAAPLYTKYIPKEREFRIYIVNGQMVDFCQKKRKLDETPKNWKIRSRENGFVYVWVDKSVLPQDCISQALKAVLAIGLDYAGVDVIFHEESQQAYVLEINTAPWLSEGTAEIMAQNIKEAYLA